MTWRETFDLSDLQYGFSGDRPHDLLLEVVSDDPDELFYNAWRRAWEAKVGCTWEESLGYDPAPNFEFVWSLASTGSEDVILVVSESDATVRDIAKFTDAAPGEMRLPWGLGGEMLSVGVGIKALVSAGLTLRKVVGAIARGRDAVEFAYERKLFEDYRDLGIIDMKLKQAILKEDRWDHARFCAAFGASDETARDLLLELNFKPERRDGIRCWRWHER